MSGQLIIVVLYTLCLTVIFVYSLIQLDLLRRYRRFHKSSQNNKSPENPLTWPKVTVQLPVFNEKYVVERLLEASLKLDYPKEQLEIQILDDSIDETTDLIKSLLAESKSDLNIVHIHRADRKGYKAGALKAGLEQASGEFIAIFDADFIPSSDFLKKTVPHFEDEKTGMVQVCWGHLNKNYSLLTKLQAFGLDAHFTVEQQGRNASSCFMNFNGTAGIWRKKTILDAGNWQIDTLTEDLDLSYRAQLKGWQFKYLEDIKAPAELPIEINAFKSQQFRWTKGAAETAIKTIKPLWKAPLQSRTKVHALFHLLNSSVFLFVLLSAILSVPMLWIKHSNPVFEYYFHFASIFLFSLIVLAFLYWTTLKFQVLIRKDRFKLFLARFPIFLSVMMGMSLHNSLAVIEGLIGIKTPFIRTPKFNVLGSGKADKNTYANARISWLTILEIILALYFVFGVFLGILLDDYALMFYHIMLVFGFGILAFYAFYHARFFNK